VTVATAKKAISNADGSEIQLMGNAVVTREAHNDPSGRVNPRIEIRGEYLHVYANTERVTSNKPVEIMRGDDRLNGDSLAFDNITQQLDMSGRVHALIQPR
jgi:lipopolysaccharide export system protein LptC